MNFIENESPQKLRGGFYTDSDIAAFLTRWVLEAQPKSILEPSCGNGAFLQALQSERCPALKRVFACEIDPAEAAAARASVPGTTERSVEIHTGDFLKWFLFHASAGERFDGVVGNPPFIRYQYLSDQQQYLAEKVFSRFGLPFTNHTNSWVPFVIASLALLAPGGRLGMVIPSEILHIRHAQALRGFLTNHCFRILIIDPEELWFDNTQQGVAMLLAEKKASPADLSLGVAVQPLSSRDGLRERTFRYFESANYVSGSCLSGKWMALLLSARERSLLEGLRNDARFPPFVQLADVDVGIVTGANKFFLVSDAVVEAFGLGPWAHPMFGRSEHVQGLIFDTSDLEANRQEGLPINFLWFDGQPADSFPDSVQRYLSLGEEQGLPKRFKCRVRKPWFRVPSVYAAPVAMLKRAHHYPRLLFNKAQAYTTDTAYRIRPKDKSPVNLVYSFLNSLTCLCAELEGRHYGGGVLELVPSEIERLTLPVCSVSEAELQSLDQRFRACTDEAGILRDQDRFLLGGNGVSSSDCDLLHEAWDRLRKRRHRSSG